MTPADLAQVLADLRGDAAVLRRAGDAARAQYVEDICDRVAASAEDYLRWLSLGEARIKSGLAERTLIRRFRELLDSGMARYNDRGDREFRSCAIPPRPDVARAREEGRRGNAA